MCQDPSPKPVAPAVAPAAAPAAAESTGVAAKGKLAVRTAYYRIPEGTKAGDEMMITSSGSSAASTTKVTVAPSALKYGLIRVAAGT